jgi:hypothetical protein
MKKPRHANGGICLKKGEARRRVIASRIDHGVEYYLHATKGYRAIRE